MESEGEGSRNNLQKGRGLINMFFVVKLLTFTIFQYWMSAKRIVKCFEKCVTTYCKFYPELLMVLDGSVIPLDPLMICDNYRGARCTSYFRRNVWLNIAVYYCPYYAYEIGSAKRDEVSQARRNFAKEIISMTFLQTLHKDFFSFLKMCLPLRAESDTWSSVNALNFRKTYLPKEEGEKNSLLLLR